MLKSGNSTLKAVRPTRTRSLSRLSVIEVDKIPCPRILFGLTDRHFDSKDSFANKNEKFTVEVGFYQ